MPLNLSSRRRFALIGILIAAAAAPCFAEVAGETRAAANPLAAKADPPQGVFLDEWMIVEMMGNRAGYMHQQMVREGDEIRTSMLMSFSLKRMNVNVTFLQVQTTTERVDGTPKAFTSRLDASTVQLDTEGVIEDGKVRITTRQFGQETVREFPYPQGALMSWGMAREVLRRGLEAGTSYELKVYDSSLSPQEATTTKVQVVGQEDLQLGDKTVKAIRATQTMKLPGSPLELVSTGWYSPEGDALRLTIPMGGIDVAMTRATREEAEAEFPPAEFFAPTLIEGGRSIDRARAREVIYALKTKPGRAPLASVPDTAMQKMLEAKDGVVKLRVTRTDHAALREAPAAAPSDALKEYLEPNAFLNSDDPEVRAMAQAARGDAKTPYELADNLRRYVTEVIDGKGMDVAFATASEVCRNKRGDCSEHAVLLAALGRANGLPSRVAAGLVYMPHFGGHNDVFGFHMWTQFLIGDTWVDFDAAQHESDCNPTHIAFSISSLRDASLGQLVYGLLGVLGNLELEVQEVILKAEE